MKWFDYTALTLVIIGAVNWLLIGIFRFDLVAFLFWKICPGCPVLSIHWWDFVDCISSVCMEGFQVLHRVKGYPF